jgi:hypothetical protein
MSGKIHGTNVHILPDENLGGGPNGQILREYVEVDRKAKIGEKIIVTNAFMNGSYYDNGDIFTVIERYDLSSSESPDCVGVYVKEIVDDYGIRDYEYKTLEPTDIVRLREENGTERRYRLVDRKGKVGEKVIVVDAYINGESYKNGDIFVVREARHSVVFVTIGSGRHIALSHFEYNVLEPVEPTRIPSGN